MAMANPFLDDLLGSSEQFPKNDQVKCVCEKYDAEYYCQDCRQYLCNTCSDHHTKFSQMTDHQLQKIEYIQSKALEDDLAVLQQPQLCSIHSEPVTFFCTESKKLICDLCASTNPKAIKMHEAFQQFKKTDTELQEAADGVKENLQKGVERVCLNDKKLEESKASCLKDIDDTAKELFKKIHDKTVEMKSNVLTIYKNKKRISDIQHDELKTKITDVEYLQSRVNRLLKGDKTTAMKLGNEVHEALKKKISELPKTEPSDDGKIFFIKNMSLLQWKCDIGYVTEQLADRLELIGGEDVTQRQPILVKLCKTEDCVIDANQLKVTWTHPTGETNISEVKEDHCGDHTVTEICTSPGICNLDVTVDGKPIKQSPMRIRVHKEGLMHTIKINEVIVSDVVLYDDDLMLVSCRTKDILKYKQSGEYVDKITLLDNVKVNRMYKMKNGGIIFSDNGNKCITLIDINGQVDKSIGHGKLANPKGLYADESTVYVADWNNICVLNIDNGQVIRTVEQERKVPDITLTKGGNVIVLYDQKGFFPSRNNTNEQCIIQVLDNKFRFQENIVKADKMWKPRGVIVDADDNIIIASENELKLFRNDGQFIKRIDKESDGINSPWGLSVANYPRRVAVANKGSKTIQIYNY